MQSALLTVDRFSMWVGKAFAWLILVQMFITTYDVTARYLFRVLPWCRISSEYPFCGATSFAYDAIYIMFGTLFMMGGAYTLSRAAHVRGDIFYRDWPVRVQATVDLIAYVLFFVPAMLALVILGAQFAAMSYSFSRPDSAGIFELFKYGEKSALSSQGLPIWPLKVVIPIAGALMLLQGIVEIYRAAHAWRTGEWAQRLADVEETETRLAKEEQL